MFYSHLPILKVHTRDVHLYATEPIDSRVTLIITLTSTNHGYLPSTHDSAQHPSHHSPPTHSNSIETSLLPQVRPSQRASQAPSPPTLSEESARDSTSRLHRARSSLTQNPSHVSYDVGGALCLARLVSVVWGRSRSRACGRELATLVLRGDGAAPRGGDAVRGDRIQGSRRREGRLRVRQHCTHGVGGQWTLSFRVESWSL